MSEITARPEQIYDFDAPGGIESMHAGRVRARRRLKARSDRLPVALQVQPLHIANAQAAAISQSGVLRYAPDFSSSLQREPSRPRRTYVDENWIKRMRAPGTKKIFGMEQAKGVHARPAVVRQGCEQPKPSLLFDQSGVACANASEKFGMFDPNVGKSFRTPNLDRPRIHTFGHQVYGSLMSEDHRIGQVIVGFDHDARRADRAVG